MLMAKRNCQDESRAPGIDNVASGLSGQKSGSRRAEAGQHRGSERKRAVAAAAGDGLCVKISDILKAALASAYFDLLTSCL